jgi:hypothetical protein
MSQKYPGGFITKSPVAPTSTAASGIWTLDQQQQAQKAGTWPAPPIFIEDVFSTWLTTGAGANITVVNGIDLAGKGGLVWQKGRNGAATSHTLFDTARGVNKGLITNDTSAEIFSSNWFTAFNSDGFSFGTTNNLTTPSQTGVNWTFAKQPKFFDVVTYTGTGSARTVAHNLGSVPGFIIVKSIGTARNWICYHRSLGAVNTIALNLTNPASSSPNDFNSTLPTASVFTVGSDASLNASGVQYVAYLFAHDAGGFGLTGTDNVISCGSLTTDGNGQATVNLGYEPQWVLIKNTAVSTTGPSVSWNMTDNMRGMPVGSIDPRLFANTSDSENTDYDWVSPTATGFVLTPNTSQGGTFANSNYIYVAIRRGPMKTPTTGTSVYSVETHSGAVTNTKYTYTTNFPVDLLWQAVLAPGGTAKFLTSDRLRVRSGTQTSNSLVTAGLSEETDINGLASLFFDSNTSFSVTDNNGSWNGSASYPTASSWALRRAPGFFDQVCYTGTGSVTTFTHNLGAVPELMIVKRRNGSSIWAVYAAPLASAPTKYLQLNEPEGELTVSVLWNNTAPTSTVFTIGASSNINTVNSTNVAYLFASCPGVSKVGGYTGTGATQTINCGFTTGARFILIKATSTTGDWYVWDSARGIVAGNDPYLRMNVFDAQVTTTDWVDTAATGFELSNAGGNLANSNGVSYIFLAIA